MIRLAILFLFWPLIASADVINVRSGEHATFSRLVFSIPSQTEWSVSPVEGGYQLSFTGAEDGFSLDEVFERIPKTRLSNIAQVAPNTLELTVPCICHLDSFLWRSDRLVIDVIDGVDRTINTEQKAATDLLQSELPTPLRLATTPQLPDLATFANGLSLAATPINSPVSARTPLPPDAVPSDISETERELLLGVSRAASQGFLEASVDALNLIQRENTPVLDETQSTPDLPTIIPAPTFNSPGIDVATALDSSLEGVRAVLENATTENCLDEGDFALEDWGNGKSFHEQVAELSEALAGEFGEEPSNAELELARLYVHFGFGAEALAALSISTSTSPSRQALTEMALLIDSYTAPFHLLKAQQGCGTAGELWAFLAGPEAPASVDQKNQIIQAFFTLPLPMRNEIAPVLSEAFLSIDMSEDAETVLRRTAAPSPENDLIVEEKRAEIASQNNDPAEALRILRNQADHNARMSPSAIIELIDLTLEQGMTPQPTDLLLVSSLRHEHRDTEVSEALLGAEIWALVSLQEYASALEQIANEGGETPDHFTDHVYSQLAENAAVDVFLEHTLSPLPDAVSAKTENAIAHRLIDVGFPEYALPILSGAAKREDAAERRYLRAEASLRAGDLAQTLDELLGLSDDRAQSLRAEAYTQLGLHENALTSLQGQQDEQSALLQFRAGAWERLMVEDDSVLANFATAYLADPAPEEAFTLADRRTLLQRSQETREAVADLLTRFDGVADTLDQP